MSNEKRLWIIEARDGAWGANGICKGELVRCGECKFYTQMDDGTYGLCGFFGGSMVNSWYCSNGERKDGERDGET